MQDFVKSFVFFLSFLVYSNVLAQMTSQWSKRIGGRGEEQAKAIALDSTGNIYCVGLCYDTTDFDPGAGVFNLISMGQSVFIAKFNSSGNFTWVKSFSVANNPWNDVVDVALDSKNNIYITGFFSDTIDIDPGIGTFSLLPKGNRDVFFLKLDSTGNFLFAKSFGGKFTDIPSSIVIDQTGNPIISGYFFGTVDFDPGSATFSLTTLPNNSGDMFVSKFDPVGNLVWAVSAGGIREDRPYDIAVDKSNCIYVTGEFNSPNADFDPGPATYTLGTGTVGEDIFLLKIDSSGNFRWAKSIGSAKVDYARGIAVRGSEIYITGHYEQTVDFDPGPSTFTLAGGEIFVSRFDSSGNHVWTKNVDGYASGLGCNSTGQKVVVSNDGKVLVTGSFCGTLDFDPSAGSSWQKSYGLEDVFFWHLRTDGYFVCASEVGSQEGDWCSGLAIDKQGRYVSVGSFRSTVDLNPNIFFQPTFTSKGFSDIFILNLSTCLDPNATREIPGVNLFTVFPNPVTSNITIRVNSIDLNSKEFDLKIFDNLGRKVVSSSVYFSGNEQTNSIEIRVEPGVYYLEIKNNEKQFKQKIIVVN